MTIPNKAKSCTNITNILRVAAIIGSSMGWADSAYAETTSDLKVSSSVGFDSNPFLGQNGNTEVASFRLELVPTVKKSDGVSEFTLSARAEHVEYSRRYDSAQNLGAQLSARTQVNERLEVSTQLTAASVVSTADNIGQQIGFEPNDPQAPISPVANDITLIGSQQRRTSFGAQTTIQYRSGEYDQFRLSSNFDIQRYGDQSGLGNSNFVSHNLSYLRQMNENLSLGGAVEVSAGDFKYIQFGDSRTISPQFVINARLSSRLNVAGSFGATFTRVDLPTGQLNSTGFSGNGTLCYKGSKTGFCLNGQRQLVPSALGGLRTQTSIGTSYSRRLSTKDTIQAGASVSRASAPLAGGFEKFNSVRIYGNYQRRLTERLSLTGSTSYTNSKQRLNTNNQNFQALLGISYKFGQSR